MKVVGFTQTPVTGEYTEIPSHIPRVEGKKLYGLKFWKDLNTITGHTFFLLFWEDAVDGERGHDDSLSCPVCGSDNLVDVSVSGDEEDFWLKNWKCNTCGEKIPTPR